MSELLTQLGINWQLLIAQAVNFFLLLVILRLTVYKPLLKILKERRDNIERGLRDAQAAQEKLAGAAKVYAEKAAAGEKKSLEILAATEQKSKELEAGILSHAKRKEEEILREAERQAQANAAEERKKFFDEAAHIVRTAIGKTVEMSPEAIDEKLARDAVAKLADLKS